MSSGYEHDEAYRVRVTHRSPERLQLRVKLLELLLNSCLDIWKSGSDMVHKDLRHTRSIAGFEIDTRADPLTMFNFLARNGVPQY
jgi:hypothetical protein